MIRTFLAIELNNEIKKNIENLQETLSPYKEYLRFVKPENIHITLKFYGEIQENQINSINKIIVKQLQNYEPFSLNIQGIGVFPNLRNIKVLWIGINNPEELIDIQKRLDPQFEKIGFPAEKKYKPHITIARQKRKPENNQLKNQIKELKDINIGTIDVKKIILKKSQLTPKGPIYTNLQSYKL